MKRPTPTAAALMLLVAAAVGCGVQPTGVLDAGQPPTGLRLYFASEKGLRAVPRLGKPTNLDSVIKLLTVGPTTTEQNNGLTNLVEPKGPHRATGDGTRITLTMPRPRLGTDNQLLNGQLVCTPAHAHAVLHPDIHPDDVNVTLTTDNTPLGPYRCANFLTT